MNKHIGIFEYQKAEKTKKIPKCHAHFFFGLPRYFWHRYFFGLGSVGSSFLFAASNRPVKKADNIMGGEKKSQEQKVTGWIFWSHD